jgi:hypothetical protein
LDGYTRRVEGIAYRSSNAPHTEFPIELSVCRKPGDGQSMMARDATAMPSEREPSQNDAPLVIPCHAFNFRTRTRCAVGVDPSVTFGSERRIRNTAAQKLRGAEATM